MLVLNMKCMLFFQIKSSPHSDSSSSVSLPPTEFQLHSRRHQQANEEPDTNHGQLVEMLTDLKCCFDTWSDRHLLFENEVRHFINSAQNGASSVGAASKPSLTWLPKKFETPAEAVAFEKDLKNSDYAKKLVSYVTA